MEHLALDEFQPGLVANPKRGHQRAAYVNLTSQTPQSRSSTAGQAFRQPKKSIQAMHLLNSSDAAMNRSFEDEVDP